MRPVAEGNALIDATGQVLTAVIQRHADETALRVRMDVGGHQERQEHRYEFRRRDLIHPTVQHFVYALPCGPALFAQLREKFPYKPLVVPR